jgi:hypothetical protein
MGRKQPQFPAVLTGSREAPPRYGISYETGVRRRSETGRRAGQCRSQRVPGACDDAGRRP